MPELYGRAARAAAEAQPPNESEARLFTMLSAVTDMHLKSRERDQPFGPMFSKPRPIYRPPRRGIDVIRDQLTAYVKYSRQGTRADVAYRAACGAGRLVAQGTLREADAVELVAEAAVEAGLAPDAARAAARRGVNVGQTEGTIREKLSCRVCEVVVAAPAPDHAIARGRAGAGLLAHIVVSKYDDHLPLYRQAEIFARDGVSLETSTLSGWVGATAAALQPLVDALAIDVLAGDTLHVDDTPVPVLAPGTGKTKTGRLWTYVRDERPFAGPRPPAALFFYSPNRKGEHPQAHLKDFRGVVHADGYAGFNELFAGNRIVEAACWAHVRRKFSHDRCQGTKVQPPVGSGCR